MSEPLVCPAGYYCDTGTVQPLGCDRGTFCPEGFWLEFKCKPGTFNDQYHQPACFSCPAGYYCPNEGTIDPLKCPDKQVSGIGQSLCTKCPAGHLCRNGIDVGYCETGGYCVDGDYRSGLSRRLTGHITDLTKGCSSGEPYKERVRRERTTHKLVLAIKHTVSNVLLVITVNTNQNFHVNALRENIYHQWAQQVYLHVRSVLLEIIAQNLAWFIRYLVQTDSCVHLGRRVWVKRTCRVRLATFAAADQRNADVLLVRTR